VSTRAATLVVGLLVLGTLVLFTAFAGAGGEGPGREPDLPSVDGVLVEAHEQRITIQPMSGGPRRTLRVEPADRPVLDLPHLQTHVQDGTPVRLFYEGDAARGYLDLEE